MKKFTCKICKTNFMSPRQTANVPADICPACEKNLLERSSMTMQSFLDSLGAAILLVDDDARVRAASRQALDLLRKDPASIEGRYTGDAIQCIHSREGGGCGKTVHCRTCTIRNAVTETCATGRPFVRIPAYADISLFAETRPVRFLISTEKIGELIMLRIDEAKPCNSLDAARCAPSDRAR